MTSVTGSLETSRVPGGAFGQVMGGWTDWTHGLDWNNWTEMTGLKRLD